MVCVGQEGDWSDRDRSNDPLAVNLTVGKISETHFHGAVFLFCTSILPHLPVTPPMFLKVRIILVVQTFKVISFTIINCLSSQDLLAI